jgi:hypothetical protein
MGTAFEDYEEPVNRTCKKCGEVKPLEQFQLHGKYWDTTCKLCRKDEVREWQKNNPDKMAANNKRWLKRTIAKAHEADETIAALTAERDEARAEVERLNITINSLQAEEEAWYDAQVELDRLKRIEAAAKGMSDSFCEGCGREPLCGDGTYDAVCMGADLKQALEGGRDDA